MMKCPGRTLVAVLLLTLAGAVQAQDTPSCAEVVDMFDSGASPENVIRNSVQKGMTLSEATVYTLVCGGEGNRVSVASAGIGLAGNLVQAQSVATALRRTAGETGPVAQAVDRAMDTFIANLPQPPVHVDSYTPYGGGVSPAT